MFRSAIIMAITANRIIAVDIITTAITAGHITAGRITVAATTCQVEDTTVTWRDWIDDIIDG